MGCDRKMGARPVGSRSGLANQSLLADVRKSIECQHGNVATDMRFKSPVCSEIQKNLSGALLLLDSVTVT